jgi:hypothetical protein
MKHLHSQMLFSTVLPTRLDRLENWWPIMGGLVLALAAIDLTCDKPGGPPGGMTSCGHFPTFASLKFRLVWPDRAVSITTTGRFRGGRQCS